MPLQGHRAGRVRADTKEQEESEMQVIRADGTSRAEPRDRVLEPATSLPPEPARYPTVLVEWHDAWFDLDDTDPGDRRIDYPVRTVGFLIREGPSVLSLAQEVLPDGEGFRAVTHIPLPIVKRVVNLEVAAP
jgi:hypothetical protein